jgi:VIT1/CCC1 family predicted Fe2+/Mn2+ transporter
LGRDDTLPPVPAEKPPIPPGHPERPIPGGKSGALRAGIFGANDGLLSNLSLIMGVAGATTDKHFVLVAGIAGLLAGAFSMATGEYVSMSAQRDVFEGLIKLERWELANMPDEERHELAEIYRRKGIPGDLAIQLAGYIHADERLALETHAKEELGLDPEGLGSPWSAAISSFLTFAVGALIPLLPFLFAAGATAIAISAVVSALTLFAIGVAMSMFTDRSLIWSGLRMMLIGVAAATTTFVIGRLLHVHGGL